MDISDRPEEVVRFESDDLIYNRFDLIYRENLEKYVFIHKGEKYAIEAYFEGSKAVLNVWGKRFPQDIYEKAIDDIFISHLETRYIEVKRAGNDYKKLLNECNDIRVPIPNSKEQLLQRLKAKHRYTLKRIKRLLEEEYGKLQLLLYQTTIPEEMVELYFIWKQNTHGTDYNMTPEEYLWKYHVTDGILLRAGEKKIGILFFCQVNSTVYLENLSYDTNLDKFSPGYLVYEMFLEELIKRKCTYLYLGGGDYSYKKRFGAEESVAYSGVLYRKEVFEELNKFFRKEGIDRIAIYGLGVGGHAFLKIARWLDIEIVYGIDREKKQLEGLDVYSPEDTLKDVDAVLITLYTCNVEVEQFLNAKFDRVYYWKELVIEIIDEGRV